MNGDIFPVMQDNSGLNLEACLIQQAMMQATGQPPTSAFAAARGLAQAVARAEFGDDEDDPMMMHF